MGEIGAFLKIHRSGIPYKDAVERVAVEPFNEFLVQRSDEELSAQGARCMECGVPFCHNGCPLGNLIPDWNDLVYRGEWERAIVQLHATNNFPEFTGRLCPAPCEASCVLEIREGDAVSIKQIENSIIDRAWAEGFVTAQPPASETGRSVAVVGSGPAGMAAAQQLRRSGHRVVLFERDEAAGGLVRFGVPDFKIEKRIVERRVQQLVDEGVELRCGIDVGVAQQAVAQLGFALGEPSAELAACGSQGSTEADDDAGRLLDPGRRARVDEVTGLADRDDRGRCAHADPEQALHRGLRPLPMRPPTPRRTAYENAATLTIGPPTVAENREVSAETFSLTWVLAEATVAAASSRIGTEWSVSSFTETRASSRTRPSLIRGMASAPTSATNANAAISPAMSPTDMFRSSFACLDYVPG